MREDEGEGVMDESSKSPGVSSSPILHSGSSTGRFEWESKMQEAPLEILRLVEEQRKRESQTWRKMESRENELKETLLRKEKEKVHCLLGEISGLKKELEQVKKDNISLQKSNILQKKWINEYKEERISLQQDRETKSQLESDLKGMLTTLKVVNNDNEVLKSTLDNEMLKHISQLKQYQAALSVFEQLKAERSKFQDLSSELDKRCSKAVTLNLLQKLRIFLIRLEKSRVLWAFHKWILLGQSKHLHHVSNHKVHQVTHTLKHNHHKTMQEMKENHEKSILDQTEKYDRAVHEQVLLKQKVERSRDLVAGKYLADAAKKYFFRWIRTCFFFQRERVESIQHEKRIFRARVFLILSKLWARIMLRKSFSMWMVVSLSYSIEDRRQLQDKNVLMTKDMRKLEAGYYKRLSQTVVMMTSRRALRMRTFYRWHKVFFESIAAKGMNDDTHSISSSQSRRSSPRHLTQQHSHHQNHHVSPSSHDGRSQHSTHVQGGGDDFREEMRKKLRINTNVSPTYYHRTHLSSPPSSTASADRNRSMGKKAWSPSGGNIQHGPYRLDASGGYTYNTTSRLPSPRSSKSSSSSASTPLSHRLTPSPKVHSRI